ALKAPTNLQLNQEYLVKLEKEHLNKSVMAVVGYGVGRLPKYLRRVSSIEEGLGTVCETPRGITNHSGLPYKRQAKPLPKYDGVPANVTRDGRPIPPLQPTGVGTPLPAKTTIDSLLMGNYAAPGRAGVTLEQRTIHFGDLFRLQERYGGIEF